MEIKTNLILYSQVDSVAAHPVLREEYAPLGAAVLLEGRIAALLSWRPYTR